MSTFKDYEKILDFIYSHPDMPDDIRQRIEQWMLLRENDRNLDAALHSLWDREVMDSESSAVNPVALSRLLSEIGDNQEKGIEKISTLGRLFKKRMVRYAAVAAIAIIASLATWFAASSTSRTDTVLVTAKGSTGEFRLPDGSLVLLNSDTRLTYCSDDFDRTGKRKVAVDGEAYFEVVKDPNHPFVVEMGKMDVEVLGTSFEVRNYSFSKSDEVVLLSGKVKVQTDANKSDDRILYPDQRLVLDKKSGQVEVENVPAVNYCRWTSPRLKLENEPLGDILITICRKYCLDLEVAPEVDKDYTLSMTLYNESIDELMPVITYLTGVNYTISGNTLYVSK